LQELLVVVVYSSGNLTSPGTGGVGTLQNENPAPGQPHNHTPSDTSIKYSTIINAMKDLATKYVDVQQFLS
jgi:hypothetical protein